MRITNKLTATLIILMGFMLTGTNMSGQDFSFKMIFEDAVGNTDTLTLGYSPNATDSVDSDLGEVNIISTELDSTFDVRVSDEWHARTGIFDSTGNFHLKKQIINGTCGRILEPVSIDIKCKNWPVTAYWDSSSFHDTCREGSLLTSIPRGGWWDVGTGSSDLYRAALRYGNQVTFTSNSEDSYTSYITESSDTISVFWVAFGKHSLLTLDIPDHTRKDELTIFPNPAKGEIHIVGNLSQEIDRIQLFDISGKRIKVLKDFNELDLSGLQSGVYFLNFILNDNSLITKKVIKE